MNVPLKPELERFIDEEVQAGRFASRTEVVEAGLARLMIEPTIDELDADDVTHLRQSLEQMRQGSVVDWREISSDMRKKHGGI